MVLMAWRSLLLQELNSIHMLPSGMSQGVCRIASHEIFVVVGNGSHVYLGLTMSEQCSLLLDIYIVSFCISVCSI